MKKFIYKLGCKPKFLERFFLTDLEKIFLAIRKSDIKYNKTITFIKSNSILTNTITPETMLSTILLRKEKLNF